MKVKSLNAPIVFLLLCVIALSGVVAGNLQRKTAFYDDFSSGSTEGKWSLDIAGDGNRFSEENGEAAFITYGLRLKDYRKEHSFLRSKVITIKNWDSVNFSGRWKFTDPGTAEMWFRVYDLDSGKYFGMRYVSWPSEKIVYDVPNGTLSEARKIPREYESFKVILYRDRIEFMEGGKPIKTVRTAEFENSTNFQLLIGGWDDSPLKSHIYFDEVRVSYLFEPQVVETSTTSETQSSSEAPSPQKTSSTEGSGKTCGPGVVALLAVLIASKRR